jgi:hypothetical protein
MYSSVKFLSVLMVLTATSFAAKVRCVGESFGGTTFSVTLDLIKPTQDHSDLKSIKIRIEENPFQFENFNLGVRRVYKQDPSVEDFHLPGFEFVGNDEEFIYTDGPSAENIVFSSYVKNDKSFLSLNFTVFRADSTSDLDNSTPILSLNYQSLDFLIEKEGSLYQQLYNDERSSSIFKNQTRQMIVYNQSFSPLLTFYDPLCGVIEAR